MTAPYGPVADVTAPQVSSQTVTGERSIGVPRGDDGIVHDGHCEAEFLGGPMAWTTCLCAERAIGSHSTGGAA